MKKLSFLLSAILICFISVSCQKRISDEEIIKQLGGTVISGETDDTELEQGNKAEQEQVEKFSNYPTGVEGLISPDFTISNGKYYYLTKRSNGYTGVEMISYVDLETKENYIICPDPLCKHGEDWSCKYTEFQEIYLTDTPGVFYSIKMNTERPPICRIDLNQDTVETVYTSDTFYTTILGMDEGKLYFYKVESVVHEKQSKYEYHFYYIDTATDELVDIGYLPERFAVEGGVILMIHKGEIYYHAKNGEIRKTDFDFSESTLICDADNLGVANWVYDEKTDELYLLVANDDERKGSLYVYRNGVTEQVNLPHENIMLFTLTNSEIYYSVYEEEAVSFGISRAPGNPEVYDLANGRVYRVDRAQPGEAELVFDHPGEYFLASPLTSYCVIDDCLYFDEPILVRENINGVDYVYYDYAITMNRIRADLKTGEITRLKFE